MSKRVVILQSNYIPWKGYFDLINEADLFIFHDDLQFTTADWRNRNKIKTDKGIEWLTIPAGRNENRLICEVQIPDQSWKEKHRRVIAEYYRKAPFFDEQLLNTLYNNNISNLSDYNQYMIKYLCEQLDINTLMIDSRSLQAEGTKTDKVIDLLRKVNASVYLSGPSGRNYLEEEKFKQEGIKLEYYDYSGYKEYPQLYNEFVHEVSVVDLLFNTGKEARNYLKSTH